MPERSQLRIKLDNFRPLGEMVFESLRDAIVNQVLKPGERLMETELADEMGVSRTPVREAIRKLEQEGYVVMIPRKGAYVAGLSIKDVNEVFEIRGALEALAAGLAATRATEEEIEEMERNLLLEANHFESHDIMRTIEADTRFHELIFKASGNDRLVSIINNLREQVQRFRTRTLSSTGRLKFALDEHRRIVEAIATRDPQQAQRMAREHIDSAENAMLELISYEK